MKTHDLIKRKIRSSEQEIERQKKQLKIEPNIESPKICTQCNTKNLNYYTGTHTWVCAFC